MLATALSYFPQELTILCKRVPLIVPQRWLRSTTITTTPRLRCRKQRCHAAQSTLEGLALSSLLLTLLIWIFRKQSYTHIEHRSTALPSTVYHICSALDSSSLFMNAKLDTVCNFLKMLRRRTSAWMMRDCNDLLFDKLPSFSLYAPLRFRFNWVNCIFIREFYLFNVQRVFDKTFHLNILVSMEFW